MKNLVDDLKERNINAKLIDADVLLKVKKWIYNKNLNNAPIDKQIDKLYEEYNELMTGINNDSYLEVIDAVGDLFIASVTLSTQLNINMHYRFDQPFYVHCDESDIYNQIELIELMKDEFSIYDLINQLSKYCLNYYDFTLEEAVEFAYDEIKDRPQTYSNEEWK